MLKIKEEERMSWSGVASHPALKKITQKYISINKVEQKSSNQIVNNKKKEQVQPSPDQYFSNSHMFHPQLSQKIPRLKGDTSNVKI